MSETATWLEALRLVAIVVGLVLSLVALGNAWLDVRALALSGRNGRLKLVANRALRAEAMRLGVQCLIFGPAALSLALPPGGVGVTGLLGALWAPFNLWATVALSCLVALWTLLDLRDRRVLVDLVGEGECASCLLDEERKRHCPLRHEGV